MNTLEGFLMNRILIAFALVLVLAVSATAAGLTPDQLTGFHARLAAARDGITTLQSSGQIRIGAYQYGKLLYHFNYAVNRMVQAVAVSQAGGDSLVHFTAARESTMLVLSMLDDMDAAHKITFVTAPGEVGFLRAMLAMGKLLNDMVQ